MGGGGGGGGPKTKLSVFSIQDLRTEIWMSLSGLKIWSESLVETRQCFNTAMFSHTAMFSNIM